jgi:hypothetical protein
VLVAALSGQELAHGVPSVQDDLKRAGFHSDPRLLQLLSEAERTRQVAALVETVRRVAALPGATPTMRRRYVLINDRNDQEHYDPKAGANGLYPLREAIAKEDGKEPVPVLIVPKTGSLNAVLQENADALNKPLGSGLPYAYTLYFEPLPFGRELVLPCPMPSRDLHGPARNPLLKDFVDVGLQGKAIVQADGRRKLISFLDKKDGDLLGEVFVAEVAAALYAARLPGDDRPPLTWAVPVADANGAGRGDRPSTSLELGSRYENRVECKVPVKRIRRHLLCVLPRPMPQGSEDQEVWTRPREEWSMHIVQERIVATREMLAAAPCIRVLKAPTWKPFMEDVILEPLEASTSFDDGLSLTLVLSLDANVRTLLRAVGAYYGVDALAAATEKGWIVDLEKLRTQK